MGLQNRLGQQERPLGDCHLGFSGHEYEHPAYYPEHLAGKITFNTAILFKDEFPIRFRVRKISGLIVAVDLNFMRFGQFLEFRKNWHPSKWVREVNGVDMVLKMLIAAIFH